MCMNFLLKYSWKWKYKIKVLLMFQDFWFILPSHLPQKVIYIITSNIRWLILFCTEVYYFLVLRIGDRHKIMCVCVLVNRCVLLFVTPWTPSVQMILKARILEWTPYHFLLHGSSQHRDQTGVSYIPGRFLTVWATIILAVCLLVRVNSYTFHSFSSLNEIISSNFC